MQPREVLERLAQHCHGDQKTNQKNKLGLKLLKNQYCFRDNNRKDYIMGCWIKATLETVSKSATASVTVKQPKLENKSQEGNSLPITGEYRQ